MQTQVSLNSFIILNSGIAQGTNGLATFGQYLPEAFDNSIEKINEHPEIAPDGYSVVMTKNITTQQATQLVQALDDFMADRT